VIIPDGSSYFPSAVFVLPQMNELTLSHTFRVFVTGMVEAMNLNFERTIAFHLVDVQASGNEFACYSPTNILLDAFRQGRSA